MTKKEKINEIVEKINIGIDINKEALENYKFCLNVDMIGVTIGFDIACCTANNSLVNYIKYLGGDFYEKNISNFANTYSYL